MSESMHGSSKVPSTNELIGQVSASTEVQDNYIDNLRIGSFDQSSINELEVKIAGVEPSSFKTRLEKVI